MERKEGPESRVSVHGLSQNGYKLYTHKKTAEEGTRAALHPAAQASTSKLAERSGVASSDLDRAAARRRRQKVGAGLARQ